jgi:hypothetical protein
MNPEQHAAHMEKVKAGLQQIMQSNDINQVKQIAQALLAEEQGEQESEAASEEQDGSRAAMLEAVKKQYGE